jgi:hypothetical protein
VFGTNLRKTKNGFKRHLADFEKPAPAPKKRRAATFTVKVTRDNRQEDYFGQNQELEQKKEIREQYLSGVKGGLEDWLNFDDFVTGNRGTRKNGFRAGKASASGQFSVIYKVRATWQVATKSQPSKVKFSFDNVVLNTAKHAIYPTDHIEFAGRCGLITAHVQQYPGRARAAGVSLQGAAADAAAGEPSLSVTALPEPTWTDDDQECGGEPAH